MKGNPHIRILSWKGKDGIQRSYTFCGPFEYENGSLSRVNFPGGYVSGGVAYHYILDHQGNVRQVVDATTGKVDQESHYYPGGMLFAESTATYFKPGSANNTYRYGCKELLTTGGLNLYQFGARMYDPSLLRFITPDPLRHETPHLSSYLYCAANPVMYVDPTGMIFKYNGTDEEIRMLERYIETLKKSRLFSSYFKHIERSDIEYSIQFGTKEDNMKTPGHYNSTKKAIFINGNNKEYENFPVIIEETFHIFQELFHLSGLYKTQYNIEYEAKMVMTLIMSEDNSKIPSFMGAVPIGIDLNSDFINMCLSGDMLDRNKYVVNILFCPYETLNKAYVAGGGFFVQSQGDAPDEYLVENVNMTQLLYNLLYEVSLP